MVIIKSPSEIALISQSCRILAQAMKEAAKLIKPGLETGFLDNFIETRIRVLGGEPAFKGYQPSRHERPFPTTSCISINDEVVHAPALPSRVLKDGDVVGLDCGARYQGWCSDMAITIGVGKVPASSKRLIEVTREALRRGMAVVRPGALVSDISRAVQTYAEAHGFGVVRDLVGHGIGQSPHEDPRIYNFIGPGQPKVELKEGMTICLEPMITSGSWQVKTLDDGWTVATQDGSLAAHFEHTLVVTKNGYEILTQ